MLSAVACITLGVLPCLGGLLCSWSWLCPARVTQPKMLVRPRRDRAALQAVDRGNGDIKVASKEVTVVQNTRRFKVKWMAGDTVGDLQSRIEDASGVPAEDQQLRGPGRKEFSSSSERLEEAPTTVWLADTGAPKRPKNVVVIGAKSNQEWRLLDPKDWSPLTPVFVILLIVSLLEIGLVAGPAIIASMQG